MRIRFAVVTLLPLGLAAQAPSAPPAAHEGGFRFGHRFAAPSATAVRASSAVVLDAKLDEAAWKSAAPITEFRQIDPDEGKPATQRTEVRFIYDDDALYVGAKMYDTEGGRGVVTRLVRRDASFDSDMLELVIDGYHDHLSRAFFDVNPSGSKADNIGIGTSCCDESWDPIWQAATSIDADGWTAELRIPYSQLRFSRDSVQTWGLQVRRFIKRRNEEDQWSFWGKTEAGGPSRFGHLEGIRMPRGSSHLELLPYVVAKSASVASSAGDPFNTRGRPTMRAGLDLKDRLTSNLTLDATFNPDFGQVEVDPAVLNLSAFETFFPEKRPFFVEGAQVFDFGDISCNFCSNLETMSAFYSRRVGRSPTGSSLALGDYAYADVPDATTILGAAKITGRTNSGYTLGLLQAVTGRATANVATTTGDRGKQEVEPLADYFVGRLKHDYRNGNLVVGGVVSGVVRDIDSTFAPRLARNAGLAGSDVYFTTADKEYSFRANVALTAVDGDPREILARQQSSARYFQRPDRGSGSRGFFSNRLDSSATALRGAGAYARAAKEIGDWFGEVSFNSRTPGYETNDYAFQQRADYIWYNANVGRIWTKPRRWYRQLVVLGGGQNQRNFEGDRTQTQLHAYVSETTPQFWQFTTFYISRPSVVDDHQLRGGPAVQAPGSQFVNLNVRTDSRRTITGNASVQYYWDARGGVAPSVSMNATYRPAPNVSMSFGPSWQRARNYAQYVSSIADTTATSFYGTRYVMAGLDQRTLGLDTRLSVTFTPAMTLELYMQPFFAAGHYYDFKEYARPRTSETLVYGRDRGTVGEVRDTLDMITQYTIDPDGVGPASPFTLRNPNFTQQSLRGNAVFRWEYRPGSVLYVAWTQSRAADGVFGDLDLARDRTALLAARPDNIFLVKASWWLPR
ncbi:MAG TPA: DUF5916 domain-containing protein [Gemmatimonadaceae bacterium]|nr:DUF5916 domain-containing protein [Gemmatimonadaceae bacterium]